MYTIKGFTTKKNILKQFKKAEVPLVFGFNGVEMLIVKKNPFKGIKCIDKEDNEVNIKQGKEIVNAVTGEKELIVMTDEEIAENEGESEEMTEDSEDNI